MYSQRIWASIRRIRCESLGNTRWNPIKSIRASLETQIPHEIAYEIHICLNASISFFWINIILLNFKTFYFHLPNLVANQIYTSKMMRNFENTSYSKGGDSVSLVVLWCKVLSKSLTLILGSLKAWFWYRYAIW